MLDLRRRQVLTLLGGAAAAWPLAARAQSPKMLRVGYSGMLTREAPHYAAFEKRMTELGYQEGRNFTFEYIQAPSIEGYEAAYHELAARNVDILLAAGNEPALRAARAAAGTTPIVFIALDFDPVEKGYVTSLSRPGSNSTGLFVSQLELAGKRVEFLRKTFPNARRVGLLWDATSREQADAAAAVAVQLAFEPRLLEVIGQPPNYAAALMPMDQWPGEPIMIPARSDDHCAATVGPPHPVDMCPSRGDGGRRAYQLRRQPGGRLPRCGGSGGPSCQARQRRRNSHAGAIAFSHRSQSQDR
jgi:putative ABC transport system substrate-binding protein